MGYFTIRFAKMRFIFQKNKYYVTFFFILIKKRDETSYIWSFTSSHIN